MILAWVALPGGPGFSKRLQAETSQGIEGIAFPGRTPKTMTEEQRRSFETAQKLINQYEGASQDDPMELNQARQGLYALLKRDNPGITLYRMAKSSPDELRKYSMNYFTGEGIDSAEAAELADALVIEE